MCEFQNYEVMTMSVIGGTVAEKTRESQLHNNKTYQTQFSLIIACLI